ncbi:MAG: Gfo/Idh/MocA family oxidoreductase [Verrucomicrobia bacterium]|nr:Gfo/Idh/MocA family oxidoreductase [Verrucomicrobiota bacterium]
MNPDSVSTIAANVPRRDFLKTAAGLALGAALPARPLTAAERTRSVGANGRLRIGIIGCGDRGREAHMEGIHKHVGAVDFEIVAVADPWRIAREKANAKVQAWFGRDAKQCVSYRELLALDGVDAVMIASPDHVHTLHLEAAARAKKHIYVEKPLATEFANLVRAVDAVKAAGTVVQVGTQIRSLPGIVGARELARSGVLGKWSRIEETRNNERPYWYNCLKEVDPADVDWKEFLHDRPMRPFRAEVYSGWYGYYEFSRGPISGYGSHFVDLVHFITGAKFPASCVCLGGTYTWQDEHRFTAPDCVQATWVYPEGFLVSSANNLGNSFGSGRKFYADKGVLKVDNWNAPTFSAEGGPRRDRSIRGEKPVPPVERPDHFLDWLQCVRDGGQPHAPIEAGYQHAVAVLMADESYKTGRKTIYDPVKREIRSA